MDHFFPVYHERREGSPPPPPDFERMLFNHNAFKPGGTLAKYISGTILISIARKCAYVIPIVPASSCFSIWWPQKTRRPWGQATTANIYRAPFWTLSRANVRMSFPSSQRLLVFPWWPQKTKRPWGQATTANWVAAKHWMRMRKNWHDPMCLLRSTCTYYFFYLKKNRHTWAIVSYNKVEDRERIEIPFPF